MKKVKPIEKPKIKWVSNPWDKKLNLVTMHKVNLRY